MHSILKRVAGVKLSLIKVKTYFYRSFITKQSRFCAKDYTKIPFDQIDLDDQIHSFFNLFKFMSLSKQYNAICNTLS